LFWMPLYFGGARGHIRAVANVAATFPIIGRIRPGKLGTPPLFRPGHLEKLSSTYSPQFRKNLRTPPIACAEFSNFKVGLGGAAIIINRRGARSTNRPLRSRGMTAVEKEKEVSCFSRAAALRPAATVYGALSLAFAVALLLQVQPRCSASASRRGDAWFAVVPGLLAGRIARRGRWGYVDAGIAARLLPWPRCSIWCWSGGRRSPPNLNLAMADGWRDARSSACWPRPIRPIGGRTTAGTAPVTPLERGSTAPQERHQTNPHCNPRLKDRVPGGRLRRRELEPIWSARPDALCHMSDVT